jgi:3-isopropylmalate dehydrogenase
MKKVLLLPGDGIGPEVCMQAQKIINWFNDNLGADIETDKALIGGIAIDEAGDPFPQETIDKSHTADAILLGAVGGPKWESLDISMRPEKGLLGIRKELELFANLRPALVFDELAEASSLKREIVSGLDILIVRELTGGIYFGEPKGVETLPDGQRKGYNTLVYTTNEIRRIAKVAFELAAKRNKRVCSVDKANVLVATELWREEVTKIHQESYSDQELTHMYVDNAAMQLIRNPQQFDVMVTTNMFGDILSDAAAMLTGSLGMLPSASLGDQNQDKCSALYEPVHGSAPDIAGQDMANPIATILSLSMMFKYSFDMEKESQMIENAVKKVLAKNIRTKDISVESSKIVGTQQMGDEIIAELQNIS